MPLTIHWTVPVQIHWTSDNPLEASTAKWHSVGTCHWTSIGKCHCNPRWFLRCRFLVCNRLSLSLNSQWHDLHRAGRRETHTSKSNKYNICIQRHGFCECTGTSHDTHMVFLANPSTSHPHERSDNALPYNSLLLAAFWERIPSSLPSDRGFSGSHLLTEDSFTMAHVRNKVLARNHPVATNYVAYWDSTVISPTVISPIWQGTFEHIQGLFWNYSWWDYS